MVQVLKEEYCAGKDATLNNQYQKLGLTDAGLVHLSPKPLILTADLTLYCVLRANKVDAVNF